MLNFGLDLFKKQFKKQKEKFEARRLRKDLTTDVEKQIQFSLPYFLLLVFSTVVSTLGLLAGSAPVVIGSMLISPLIWSIFGISLGLVTRSTRFLMQALKSFFVGMVVVLLVSIIATRLIGFTEITGEIYARLNLSLIDVLVGLAAGTVGIIALYYPKASSPLYLTGVSIALSLLPSLATVGIGISHFHWQIALSAILLFGANVLATILASSAVLFLLKFHHFKT